MVGSHPPRAQVGLGRLGTTRPSLPRPYRSHSWGCEIQSLDLRVGMPEGVLLRGDSIFSGGQWRGALGISLSTGARGLGITTLFLFSHLKVGALLLLLLADLLFQVGLVFLNAADLLLQHPTVLDEVLKFCNRPLYHTEGGLQSIQPMLHLPTRQCIGDYLHGLRHGIKLVTEFGSPVEAFPQRGNRICAFLLIVPLIFLEDLVDYVLEL